MELCLHLVAVRFRAWSYAGSLGAIYVALHSRIVPSLALTAHSNRMIIRDTMAAAGALIWVAIALIFWSAPVMDCRALSRNEDPGRSRANAARSV